MDPLFDPDFSTPVVALISVTSKVAAPASAKRILDILLFLIKQMSSSENHSYF
jgi:hypothetical protein